MNNKISLKGRLVAAVLALIMLVTSLLGTTFAWFTDSATSGSNVITAGRLDVNMYWSDTLLAVNSTEWKHADGVDLDVFSHENWEPGYTEVKYVKIANEGSLDLKWQLSLEVEDEIGKLAEVIDVYYVNPATSEVTSLAGLTTAGTLDKVISSHKSTSGTLLEEDGQDSVVLAIAMHMQESAGNEYQAESVSGIAGFKLHLVATQLSSESDSFGSDYDKDATFPTGNPTGSASVSLAGKDANNDGLLDAAVTVDLPGGIKATLPEGTKLADGATQINVTVDNMASSSNILVENDEEVRSLNVHAEGVAEDNTVPAVIEIPKTMPKGLNIGNYRLYHVENGTANEMKNVAAPTDHNDFSYDPVTGSIAVAMATYSEVALVADTEKAWEGEFDYTWYDASKTELTIANADQLAAFGAIVGGMAEGIEQDSFSGKTVKLLADINLGDAEKNNKDNIIFYPIGYNSSDGKYEKTGVAVTTGFYNFCGTFDGNGNTIANFYQNTWEMKGDNNYYDATLQYYRDGMGLFGKLYGATVKNLTVDNFSSDGEYTTTGAIAAYADSKDGQPAIFENISITNCNPRVYNIGNGGIVGCAGWYSKDDSLGNNDYTNAVVFRNITVDQTNKISALWGTYDVSCGGILGQYYPDSNCGIKLENCHVSAIIDVNNDVCANYQYYWYRYSGMFIGTIRANTKDDAGYTVADATGIIAKDCTYSYGSWNEYWYCELVKNSSASYTHDYQFGRLTNIDNLSEIKSGETWLKEGNFALVSDDRKSVECYHIFKDSNGNLYRHFHDVADESNPNIYEDFDLNGDGLLNDLKEDRQRYYLPFGQVFNGLGYGVKPTYTYDGFKLVEDGTVISGEKFNVKDGADLTYRPGETVYLKDLVNLGVDESKLSQSSLYVSASPIGDGATVSIKYNRDVENWENNNFVISNDTKGAFKLVITDYFYCTPTVIVFNAEEALQKFEAKNVSDMDAYTQITLGDLFTATGIKQDVTATVLVDGNAFATINGTAADWASKTIDLTKDGKYTVTIKENDDYCEATMVEFTVNKADKFTKKFDKDFLYRVGNQNTVGIGYIFGETETSVKLSSVNVTIENVAGNASGAFTHNATWTNGTIQFTGTGVVKVTISADGAKSVELNLEVVEAKNYPSTPSTSLSATANNVVLLQDVSGSFTVSNGHTFYGNGFTVTLPTNSVQEKGQGFTGYVSIGAAQDSGTSTGGNLDNVRIVGPEYPEMYLYRSQAEITDKNDPDYAADEKGNAKNMRYFRNSVIVYGGNCTISNSYISGCRTPVCLRGGNNVVIENTTLSGGSVANMQVAGVNSLMLRDLTTDGHLGVYVDSSAVEISIEGELHQYNWVTESEWITAIGGETNAQVFPDFFNNKKYESYWHMRGGVKYVNMAFIFACDWEKDSGALDTEKQTNNAIYCATDGIEVSTLNVSYNGGVYSVANQETLTDGLYNKPMYVSHGFNPIAPSLNFDNTPNNDDDDANDTNDTYCVYNESTGVLKIGVSGNSKTIDLSKVIVTKNGAALTHTVYLNGTQINGNSVTIKSADGAKQTLTFKATSNDAGYDKNGNPIDGNIEYTWTVTIEVATLSYPAPVWNMSDNYQFDKNNFVYAYYSTSSGYGEAVQIYEGIKINYYDKTGKLVNLDLSGTTTHPTGSNNSNSNAFTYTLSDGSTLTMKFSSGWKSGATTHQFTTYNKKVYIYPQSLDNDNYIRAKVTNQDFDVKINYTFTDPNGQSVSQTMRWYNAKSSNGNVTTVQWKKFDSANGKECVTPDTLITLANGTQVRVDSLTGNEELLVWNMETGKLDKAPIMFVDSDAEAEFEVIKLYFSDGTEVKVIGEHGFWDYDLNKYVYLDANAADYIGHTFAKQNGDSLEKVQLVDVVIETEVTEAWSPVTAGHLCYFVNGMLSMPGGVGGLFNIFEVDPETMTYDYEQMEKDIETYGLYTYEELNAICPLSEEMFNAAGGAYLKISIGKGNMTLDDLIYMINRYSKFI